MDLKDYYTLLGVDPGADPQTIRQAYRKLAREYHPDVNPGKQDAEEGFKAISEAYRVLSDQEQRKQYDSCQGWPPDHAAGPAFDWRRWSAQPEACTHFPYPATRDLEQSAGAESAFSGGFTMLFGQAHAGEPGTASQRGQDVEHPLDITLEEAFRGMTCLVQVNDCRVEVRILPGVQSGSRVCLAGLGQPGYRNGPPGDLYLVIHVLPHPCFERQGDDLYTTIAIDIYTAVLGGEVTIPDLAQPLRLVLPPRTHQDCVFQVQGRGMPRPGEPEQRGHLYVRVRLALPESLSEHEVNTLRELAAFRQGG
jgi:curved DNA-binding protein